MTDVIRIGALGQIRSDDDPTSLKPHLLDPRMGTGVVTRDEVQDFVQRFVAMRCRDDEPAPIRSISDHDLVDQVFEIVGVIADDRDQRDPVGKASFDEGHQLRRICQRRVQDDLCGIGRDAASVGQALGGSNPSRSSLTPAWSQGWQGRARGGMRPNSLRLCLARRPRRRTRLAATLAPILDPLAAKSAPPRARFSTDDRFVRLWRSPRRVALAGERLVHLVVCARDGLRLGSRDRQQEPGRRETEGAPRCEK